MPPRMPSAWGGLASLDILTENGGGGRALNVDRHVCVWGWRSGRNVVVGGGMRNQESGSREQGAGGVLMNRVLFCFPFCFPPPTGAKEPRPLPTNPEPPYQKKFRCIEQRN